MGILYGVYLLILILIAVAGLVLLNSIRTKGSMSRALNMSLFRVTLPREEPREGAAQKQEKELIAVMEQLFSSLSNIHAKGWNRFLYGEPYIALELSVHHVGEEIHFYIAVPRNFEHNFEKLVHGLYQTADVEKAKDYNIFNPNGATAGGYLALKGNPILPFRTYMRLESDPMGAILTSLSKLQKEGEGAAIQILIRPSHRDDIRKLAQKVAREMQAGNDYNKALSLARSSKPAKPKDASSLPEAPKVVSAFEEEIIKSLQSKASRPLFDANIRLIVSADTQPRAEELLNELAGAFVQYSGPDFNSLSLSRVTGRSLDRLAFNFAFRIFSNGTVLPLSSEELTSLYHFPLATSLAPKVRFLKAKPSEPPPNLPEQGVVIGKNVFRGQEKLVRMTDNDRRRHLYIVGQTGTGKSSFMKNMLTQDIENGKGVCIVDPHGEFAEYILSVIPKERADDVIYFNPGDIQRPVGLNMLEIDPSKPEQKTFVANELLSIIKSVYKDLPEAFGPMFEQYFKNAVLLLLDDYANEIPTLAEIPKVLADDEYRRDKLSRETNPLVKNFWELEAEKAGGEAALANMVPYITSKLNPFLANDYVRPIVSQARSAFNFRDIIDGQKVLIVNLSKGRIGDINANLMGMIIVSKLLMASLSRVDMPEDQRKDFYLYIDEFQNFTTESIATILSEARKYRLDLIIAHQFVKQLTENIRDAVFGNVGSMAAFRVGPDDAEALEKQFAPTFSQQDLMNIDNFNAYVKLLINNQTTRPFNIQTIREKDGNLQVAEAIREISRLTYGRPLQEVEAEITARYQKTY